MDDQKGKLNDAASMMHELFLSYIRAGFKRSEALELIKVHIANLDHRGERHDDR